MSEDQFVHLAHERGWLDAAGLARISAEQSALASRGIQRSAWFLAQDLGLISEAQARELQRGHSARLVRALTVEGWTLSGRLGSGGMGDVFRAVAPDGRQAAVKLLRPDQAKDQEQCRRFAREARASLRLRHPHIVASLGAGACDGTRYLVMELVNGPTLKDRINARAENSKDGKPQPALTTDEAICLLSQLASALAYAKESQVLHRDVKPANILLAPPRPGVEEPFCARLCDFGLAKILHRRGEDDDSGTLTATGVALGTPHYMSPEQATASAALDHRSDMYGLGATLFHALVGQPLFQGQDSMTIMRHQVSDPPDLTRVAAPGREGLLHILQRLLAKSPADRYPTWAAAQTAIDAMAPALAQRQAAAVAGYAPPPPAPRRDHHSTCQLTPVGPACHSWRGPLFLFIGLTIGLVVVAITVVALRPASPQRHQVTPENLPGLLLGSGTKDQEIKGRQDLTLTAGTYAHLVMGRAHAGWALHGSAGVVVAGITCHPGALDVTVTDLTVVGSTIAPGVWVAPGARLLGHNLVVHSPHQSLVVDGQATLTDCHMWGGERSLTVGVDGLVTCARVHATGPVHVMAGTCLWTGGSLSALAPILSASGARVVLDGVGLDGESTQPGVPFIVKHGGTVDIRGEPDHSNRPGP